MVRGLPKPDEEEILIPTKLAAAIDIIEISLEIDHKNGTPESERAKFVMHIGSREVLPMVVYVSQLIDSCTLHS
jgi:hypothetical protein